jgi:hypothetical protein
LHHSRKHPYHPIEEIESLPPDPFGCLNYTYYYQKQIFLFSLLQTAEFSSLRGVWIFLPEYKLPKWLNLLFVLKRV